MDLKVGDRVKVKDSEWAKPRNLAGRYGHVEVLELTSNGWEAKVAFNDFERWITATYLQKCKTN